MKAVIYARVSTAGQTEGTGLQTQIEACEKYAKENKISVDSVFREVGSGSSLVDRQQLDIIRRSIRSGSYTHLIAYAVDRLSRSVSHLFILLDECDRFGVNVLFATENLDSSPEGRLLQSVKGYVAEVEREKIRERTMRGRKQHAINGTLSYRRGLFGYRVGDNGRREILESEADTIRYMFRSIIAGGSLRSTAEALCKRSVSTPSGSDVWWAHSIKAIVNNPAYCGKTVAFRYRHDIRYENGVKKHNGSVIRQEKDWIELPDTTPAIVTEEVFNAVQEQLQKNRKEKRGTPKIEFLLRGFVKCANCGRQYSPQTSRGFRRYSCSSIQNPTINCHTKSLNAGPAEDNVWIEVLKIINGLTIPNAPEKPKTDPLKNIDTQILRLEREMCRIVDRSASADDRTWDMFDRELKKKADELEKLQVHKQNVLREQSAIPKTESLKTVQNRYKKTINNLPFAERVNVMKALGVRCTWDGITLNINIHAQY